MMLDRGTDKPSIYPLNDDARRVLDTAKWIARSIKYNWVGTEALLLALVKYTSTIAGQCLQSLGLEYDVNRTASLHSCERAKYATLTLFS